MKKFFFALGTLVGFLAFGEDIVTNSSSLASCQFDTRNKVVHVVTNSVAELLDFAYNNTAAWHKGGDLSVTGAVFRLVEMDAHGTPSLVTNWTDTTCFDDYVQSAGEGATPWVSDRKAFYRAELLLDGSNVLDTAYFDFSGCGDSGIKNTLSIFTTNQVTMALIRDDVHGYYVMGTVVDTNGVALSASDYVFLYSMSDPLHVTLQGRGGNWGGRSILPLTSTVLPISVSTCTAAFDTRSCCPRRPASTDEILPFAYDVAWTDGVTEVASVSIAPYPYGEPDEQRRNAITVTNATAAGLGEWTPTYKGLYQARLVSKLDGGATVTNTVDFDLGALNELADYVAAEVVLPDGTVTNLLTLKEALAVAHAQGGGSVTLKIDRKDDLALETGDDIVFNGGAFTLDGGFDVPDGAKLAIVGGTFTSNPASPNNHVPGGCVVTPNGEPVTSWTVSAGWLVGLPTAEDVVAFLTTNGELRIIGKGDMISWGASVGKNVPWSNNVAEVTKVLVGPRVTSIGSEAFSNCVNLVSVTLPGTIQNVGRDAFAGVNTNGTDVVQGAGFVTVTYSPAKTGVESPFAAKGLKAVGGYLTAGTYSYDPEKSTPNEVAAGYTTYADDGCYTIGEVWAVNEQTGAKYVSLDNAVRAAGQDAVIRVTSGNAGVSGVNLQSALDRGVVITGEVCVAVLGSITNGTLRCPVRILEKPISGKITGGDFYGPVSTPDGAISGGTFSIRPVEKLIAADCTIIETLESPVRYRVVALGAGEVEYPQVVEWLSYTGGNLVGVLAPANVVMADGGVTNATEVGVYTASFTPEGTNVWAGQGGHSAKTVTWGVAPALAGAKTGYDAATGGWTVALTGDLDQTLVIPDSFGASVGGRVTIKLNGFAIKPVRAALPAVTNGAPAILVTHTANYAGADLDLTISGPGSVLGGDGADGLPDLTAGGEGAEVVAIAAGARVKDSKVTFGDGVNHQAGNHGKAFELGGDVPAGLLWRAVVSAIEYTAVAIPFSNETGDNAVPTLESLIWRGTLVPGDEAYVFNHSNKHMTKYSLNASTNWVAVPVVEVSTNGWTVVTGQTPCELDRGYGLLIRRVEATHRANHIYLKGREWTDATKQVTLAGGEIVSGKTVRAKTLVSNPYDEAWDLNERVNWSGVAAKGDRIQLNGDVMHVFNFNGSKWVPLTVGTSSTKIPVGYSFWYLRADTNAATLTFPAK